LSQTRGGEDQSAHWFQKPNDFRLEPHLLVGSRGARIVAKHRNGQPVEALGASPVLGCSEQPSSDSFALMALRDDEIGNVAVLALGIITLRSVAAGF
jgi:hypothetical protein